jgi:radical SAM protein with 4Fe4S-binding SPASM domain
MSADLTMADLNRYNRINVEITSACNLRCVYCHQSDPQGYPQLAMRDEWFDMVVSFCRLHGLGMIDFTGAGEATFAEGWQDKCRRVQSLGIDLHMTTNLAEPLTWEAARVLARFAHLYISVDTVDRDLLRRIRRRVDIRTITHNLLTIRAAARAQDLPPPFLAWNCVGTDVALSQLDQMVSVAIESGINEFKVLDLKVWDFMNDDPEAPTLRHPAMLEGEEFLALYETYKRAVDILKGSGMSYWIQPSLVDSLEASHQAAIDPASNAKEQFASELHVEANDFAGPGWDVWTKRVDAGMTRNCLDPWTFMQIVSTGYVRPCCFGAFPIGNLKDGGSLEEIANGEKARALRHQLLTGELSNECRSCNARDVIAVDKFRANVGGFLGVPATEGEKNPDLVRSAAVPA